ncbi:MAG: GNAT family N-acetyltransferase [Elusimicrobiota bacterium]
MKKINYVSVEQALGVVRSGQHLFVGSGCAEPELLVKALVARAGELHDVEIFHLLTAGTAPYAEPALQGSFRHNAFFIGSNVRTAVRSGAADYTPCFLHEIPRLIRSGRVHIDVALVQVSPPDSKGLFSLGISVDIVRAAVETAPMVVAQVNPRMPRTRGQSRLPASAFDLFVQGTTPLLELSPRGTTPEAEAIGRHCAAIVDDGSTLQMGIGAIPDAVLSQLGGKNDLGVHTEMFSDGLLPLIKSGVVNGRRKTLHRGKIVTSFCMGTRPLYDAVDDNPAFLFCPSDYVNDPFVIAQNDRMVSVNSALQVDLTGQVCADSIGARFYSGFGGQVDFIRGATRSKEGKAVIALPSTAKGGSVSRLVATLDPGAGVVTTRADVDVIVTEWGIASLKGRSVRERALALISIAHPRFRPELLEKAKELGFVYPDQKPLPLHGRPYPVECETKMLMRGGSSMEIRPLRTTDERALRDLFYSHSAETIMARYGQPLKTLSREQVLEFVTLDYGARMALGAFERLGRASRLLGVVRWDGAGGTSDANLSLTIHDDFQGRGIGSFLVRMLLRHARRLGLSRLRADYSTGILGMDGVARATGARVEAGSGNARRAVWELTRS